MTTEQTQEDSATRRDGSALSDQLGLAPERAALARLVAAYSRKALMDRPKTYGGTLHGIADEMERDHRRQLGAEQELQAALAHAARVLEA